MKNISRIEIRHDEAEGHLIAWIVLRIYPGRAEIRSQHSSLSEARLAGMALARAAKLRLVVA